MEVGGDSACRDKMLGRMVVGDVGGEKAAETGDNGISRDMRLVVETDIPAF